MYLLFFGEGNKGKQKTEKSCMQEEVFLYLPTHHINPVCEERPTCLPIKY